ncbi:putative transposase element L1Md-A101/L1Md-A102/L1Md-A2 [Labeo rohita]|uniref:Putative transposase element L1Md-A101/L1Md-A102/L1Md-A2 n=1 Tax=Labeo rohita TaxID=84645 RepID=A0A498P673_LABRO|nr:putative transposase element L1Md-A101/L1Md-A102/L1Md-A2 [Labeo rohita]
MQKNREAMKEDLRVLREEIFPELATLHKVQAESMNEYTEMGKSLTDTMDRVAVLEQSRERMAKEHKKMQEKCVDLENHSRRQNLRFIGIPEGVEAGNPFQFIKDLLLELFAVDDLGDSRLWIVRTGLSCQNRNQERGLGH